MRSVEIASSSELTGPLAPTIARWGVRHECPKGLASLERLPASSQMHIVRRAVHWVFEDVREGGGAIGFARVTETGVWDSSEDPVLAELVHAAIGGAIAAQEPSSAVVIVEDAGDLGLLRAAVFLWMCFGWGWVVGNADGSRVVAANHDGAVWSPSGEMPSFF